MWAKWMSVSVMAVWGGVSLEVNLGLLHAVIGLSSCSCSEVLPHYNMIPNNQRAVSTLHLKSYLLYFTLERAKHLKWGGVGDLKK